MITASVIVILIYAEQLIWAIIGINRLQKEENSEEIQKNIPIGIIVPFRNEIERILPLLKSLDQLKNDENVQLVFVDDFSEDNTAHLIREKLSATEFNYQIIQREAGQGSPKKIAIEQAVKLITHPWIITLDADVELPPYWLPSIRKALAKDPDLLLGPISLKTGQGLLGSIQFIETAGISQLGRGKAGMKRPFVANGAHLAYKKEWFNSVGGYKGNRQIASGDDMFLLKKAVDSKANVHYLNNPQAVVQVQAESGLWEFIQQRIRWLGKSKAVNLRTSNWLGVVVTTANLWTITLVVCTLASWIPIWHFVYFLAAKTLLDYWLISHKSLLKPKWGLMQILLANLLYPFLMTGILLLGVAGGYRWKGRAYKK